MNKILKRIIQGLIRRRIINNIFTNYFFYTFKKDRDLRDLLHPYTEFVPSSGSSLQEIAGYSENKELNEVLNKIHANLKEIEQDYLPTEANILDIGCGPGLFLKELNGSHKKTGIDISSYMVNKAKEVVPKGEFLHGSLLDKNLMINKKFDLIYSVGMLIYLTRSEIKDFFNKITELLTSGGVLMISYPHAQSFWDIFYPDYTYVHYSPKFIESLIKENYEILKHEHIYDRKKVKYYDSAPYKNKDVPDKRTYKNSYILIARKQN